MGVEIEIQPKDLQTARAQIDRTRARMSDTIDEIEGVLLEKKAEIRDRLDFRARIREKPLHAAGITLGLGLLLGLITGGRKHPTDPAEKARADHWESRTRRLLAIAQDQEAEIEVLEAVLAELEAEAYDREVEAWEERGEDWDDEEWDDEEPVDSGPSRWSEMKENLRDRVGDFVSEASRTLMDELRSR